MMSRWGTQEWLGVLAFLTAIAFWNGALDGSLIFRWCLPALGLPILLLTRKEQGNWTLAHTVGLAYLLLAFISLAWTLEILDGAQRFLQIELVAVPAFCIGASVKSLKWVYVGFALGLIPSALLAIGQAYFPEHQLWYVVQAAKPAGLWMNRNTMAEISALVLIGLLASRIWWAIPAPIACLLIAQERIAFAALGLAAAGWLWSRHKIAAIGIAVLILGGGGYTILTSPPESSAGQRMAIWQDSYDGLTPLGRGIGSFLTAWPEHLGHYAITGVTQRPDHAHNDFVEALFELGPLGAALLLLLFALCLCGAPSAEGLIVLALATECLAAFPLHLPATLFLGALAGGRAAVAGVPIHRRLYGLAVAYSRRHVGASGAA